MEVLNPLEPTLTKNGGRGVLWLTRQTGPLHDRLDRLTCLSDLTFGCLPASPESGSMTRRAHRLFVGWLAFADAAIPTLALLKLEQGLQQLRPIEIRPQRFGHENLRIGNLPEQKITDAHLAAGPDQQIGIGQPVGI